MELKEKVSMSFPRNDKNEGGDQEKEEERLENSDEMVEDFLHRKEYDWEKEDYFTPKDEENFIKMANFYAENQGLVGPEGLLVIDDKVVDMKMYLDLKNKYNEIYCGRPIPGKDYTGLELIELKKIRERIAK